MMAPEPPTDYVHRPAEFDRLKSWLLDSKGDAVAITAALRGAGGYGKTTLAKKLAHDPEILNAYLDGVLWVELGEKPQNLLSIVSDLVTRLTGQPPQLETLNAAASALGEALGERRLLLVIDDVWREQDLRPFLHRGPNTTRLITTRVDSTAPSSALRQKVDALAGDEAVELLATDLPGEEVSPLRGELAALASQLGEWPLMLKLVNGFLRQRVTRMQESLPSALAGVVKRLLGAKGFAAFDARDETERNRAVTRTINISLDMLDAASRERFAELAVFPEDADIPMDVIAAYWEAAANLDMVETEDLLGYLEGLSLLLSVDVARRIVRLHDTIRHFLRSQVGSERLREMHRRLVNVLEKDDDNAAVTSYRYRRLLGHLSEASDKQQIEALLLDPQWLAAKLRVTSAPIALAEDFRDYGSTRMHDYIGRTFRLCAGILARDPNQLVAQLVGRLSRCDEDERLAFVERLLLTAPRPSMFPAAASLTPPGAELARLEGHTSWISAVVTLSDGRIASGSFDQTIRIWDPDWGALSPVLFNKFGGRVRSIAQLTDGQLLFGSDDGVVRLWDRNSTQESAYMHGHSGAVTSIAVLADGRIASGGEDGRIFIWETGQGDNAGPADVIMLSQGGWVMGLAALTDGSLASVGGDRIVRIWNPSEATKPIRTLRGHESWIGAICAASPGRIITGSADRTVRVWDTDTGTELARLEGHTAGISGVAMLPNGKCVSASEDMTLRIWDLSTRTEHARLEGHSSGVHSVAVLADGRIASGSSDNTIRIWDSGGQRSQEVAESRVPVNAIVMLPDGRLVAAGADRTLRLWDPMTGEETGRLSGQPGNVITLVALPDGRLMSGSDDNTVRVWDTVSGTEPVKLERQKNWLKSLAVFPDGRVVSGNFDASIRFWDDADEIETPPLLGHRDAVRALAVLPDGRLVSGSSDRTIRIWDAGVQTVLIEGHRGAVNALSILPGGRFVSASEDKTIRIWDPASGSALCSIELDAAATAVCCVSKNRLLAADAVGRLHWLEILP
jgi:WD40 repeat protein